jgi:hypothetical protein
MKMAKNKEIKSNCFYIIKYMFLSLLVVLFLTFWQLSVVQSQHITWVGEGFDQASQPGITIKPL